MVFLFSKKNQEIFSVYNMGWGTGICFIIFFFFILLLYSSCLMNSNIVTTLFLITVISIQIFSISITNLIYHLVFTIECVTRLCINNNCLEVQKLVLLRFKFSIFVSHKWQFFVVIYLVFSMKVRNHYYVVLFWVVFYILLKWKEKEKRKHLLYFVKFPWLHS